MNFEHRSLGAQLKGVDDAGVWEAIASTTSVDRDGEVVAARCFEPLPSKVPVRLGHFGGPLIGSGRPFYAKDDELRIAGRFASTAAGQEARTLAVEGHLTDMSVVFLPVTDKQVDGRRHITAAELLAVDFVEVPSNRDARLLAVRSHSHSLTVAEARRMADEVLRDLVRLDLDDSGAMLRRLESAKATPMSRVEFRGVLGDAQQLLRDLERRP